MADIRALHDIVVAAQELLDAAPDPKPLPAAALFKAYDEVLPKYGIDPDIDHHLSAFIFRVGGERGEVPLLHKFQTILGRMGIVLEFGDNTSTSFQKSSSNSPASSNDRKNRGENSQPDEHLPGYRVSKSPSLPDDEALDKQAYDRVPTPWPQTNGDRIVAPAQRPGLSSVLGRWRRLAAQEQDKPNDGRRTLHSSLKGQTVDPHIGQDRLPSTKPVSIGNITRSSELQVIGPSVHADRENQGNFSMPPADKVVAADSWPLGPSMAQDTALNAGQGLQRHTTLNERPLPNSPDVELDEKTAHGVAWGPSTDKLDVTSEPSQGVVVPEQGSATLRQVHPKHETPRATNAKLVDTEADNERLLRRAARAREIYLASKVFNHWADRTARRLERDAVARRHMIRFRCFRGWSQAPSSRDPLIDRLRVVTTVKKWQRHVAEQSRNVRDIANAASAAHQLNMAQMTWGRWSRYSKADVACSEKALRTRARITSHRMLQASRMTVLKNTIQKTASKRTTANTLNNWHARTEEAGLQLAMARQLRSVQVSYSHLREWWDQAEVDRRAKMFRQVLFLSKAHSVFNQWNLQARAQAFSWRREYLAVARTFDKWLHSAEQMTRQRDMAETIYRGRVKLRITNQVKYQQVNCSQLSRLEQRARLYINGTRLITVFGVIKKKRENREKERVKRYLMLRYTQMSSRRKQRNFFGALNKWRMAAVEDDKSRRTADEVKMQKNSEQLMLAIQAWADRGNENQQRLEFGQFYYVQDWLDHWSSFARVTDQQEMDAWQQWAAEKNRQYVKQWSISTLQQSGQAHTATKVQKRYDDEKRSRCLRLWRQAQEASRDDDVEHLHLSRLPPRSIYGRSWRALSARRSTRRHDDNNDHEGHQFETPTRWTGMALPTSRAVPQTKMDSVQEIDEGDGMSSASYGEGGLIASPTSNKRRPDRLFALSSTTPRAPVPPYLELNRRVEDGQPASTDSLLRATPAVSFRSPGYIPSKSKLFGSGRQSFTAPGTTSVQFTASRPPRSQSSFLPTREFGTGKIMGGTGPSGSRHRTPEPSRAGSVTRSVRIRSPEPFPARGGKFSGPQQRQVKK